MSCQKEDDQQEPQVEIQSEGQSRQASSIFQKPSELSLSCHAGTHIAQGLLPAEATTQYVGPYPVPIPRIALKRRAVINTARRACLLTGSFGKLWSGSVVKAT